MEDLKKDILEQYDKGNIVIAGFDGLQVCKLDDFLLQPVDGMLYDLNRLESVVLTFLPDKKWINDYAVAKVIRGMANRIHELEERIKKTDNL